MLMMGLIVNMQNEVNKMKKIIALILVFVMCLSFASCNETPEQNKSMRDIQEAIYALPKGSYLIDAIDSSYGTELELDKEFKGEGKIRYLIYDAVMINFWYRTCYWCNEEFPFMEEAYQDYKDDIGPEQDRFYHDIIILSNEETSVNTWLRDVGYEVASDYGLGLIKAKECKNIDLSNMRYPITGGEKILKAQEIAINEFFKAHNMTVPLMKGYGMCELGGSATVSSFKHSKLNGVGYPIKGVTVSAFDVDTNEEMKYGERGEIRVDSFACMKGYFIPSNSPSRHFLSR